MKTKDMLKPIWEDGVIFRETFACVSDEAVCKAAFLRKPDRVLAVESYDGLTTYVPEKDYRVEDGQLILTENTSIPHAGSHVFYYDSREVAAEEMARGSFQMDKGPVAASDGRYIHLDAVGHPEVVTGLQVAVTYETSEKWEGYRPVSEIRNLPGLYDKLKRKEKVRIVLYGDSISTGCDCSGMYGQEPNQPQWFALLIDNMREVYGAEIEFINTSVGGVDTEWAIRNSEERAASYQPDLVILGFGMNDRCRGEEYQKKTERLIRSIREKSPETEYVLIATTLPNPMLETPPYYFCLYQHECAQALRNLCGEGVVLADVQSVQQEAAKRKDYLDLTGNLLNHPNDYLVRIQAQVLNTVLMP